MHSRVSRLAFAGLAAGTLAVATACGNGGSGSTGSGSGSGGGLTVGLSSPVMAQEGQKNLSDGFKAAASSLGWKAKVYDANLSADTQVSNVQTMIDQQVGALGAWALDDNAIAGVYANAKGAGIPVVGVNSAGSGVTTAVWWEVNTCKSGGVVDQLAALFAKDKPHGKIAVISGPPAPSIVALTKCFTAAAKQAGLTVVTQQDNTQDTSSGASSLAQDLLSAHPDIDGFWSYNDASALGVSSAVIAAGKKVYSAADPGGIVVTGVNGDSSAITAVRSGTVTATVDTDPECTGWTVAAAMQAAKKGGAPAQYVVKSDIVTGATVKDFVAPKDRTCSLTDLPLVK
ncbi:sugar ABC transporter substrate-binding protein [Streptomyces sp. NBC_01476]|uniref:sugar ABC transporter substrate-binding protein n=1 Tax=Streptomyces sp. NBC_01476 TaxID=2903881 RepID=UPI002E34D7EF|nr:sugar ABC transporter substrate-binding protein [Streptomyces sp. NBC_01476]